MVTILGRAVTIPTQSYETSAGNAGGFQFAGSSGARSSLVVIAGRRWSILSSSTPVVSKPTDFFTKW